MSDVYIHIGEMLARNGRNYPEKVALVERVPAEGIRREMTWKEFDRKANQTAAFLQEKGIRKGDRVIHLMHNSIDWLVAYFGILRTGAWVVPLNFRFTREDIRYCAQVAEPKALIFGPEFSDKISPLQGEIPSVELFICCGDPVPDYAMAFEIAVSDTSPDPLPVDLGPTDPCGLYFTSGTTGQPKPILLTHENMSCAAVTEKVHHGQTHEDTFILIPPLYHTGAKMHWFGSLVVGGPAVILKGVSPQWIFEAVSEERATIVWLLVPWVQDILVQLEQGKLKPEDYTLDQWRLMHIGAMPVPPSLIQRWRRYFPGMDYDTIYGLSEATGPNCIHLGVENIHKVGAIGKAGFNWEAKVVDDLDQEVLLGQTGELLVRGNGLMREYYKNPEATAQALKGGWLHTGDIVRRDEDGFIFLVDRKKDLIISGGENVFPVEVEDFLHTHPAVKDAAAIGYPDDRLGEVVAVVIDLKPGASLTESEILDYCQSLPRYKRPRKVFFGPVPRNPTGKIEKPHLRKKYSGREEAFKQA
jgi:acyl-CoA synthetase (AMP-forming)/AMP-acid ligase II